MRVRYRLEDPELSGEVETNLIDNREFERRGAKALGLPRGALKDTVNEYPLSYLTWLSWHASHRRGYHTLAYDEWAARNTECEVIEAPADNDDDDDDDENPTQPVA